MPMMFACKTVETKTEVVNVIQTEYIYPPDSLLQPCAEQKELNFSTNGEMLMSLIQLSTDYTICYSKMQNIINYINNVKLSNDLNNIGEK